MRISFHRYAFVLTATIFVVIAGCSGVKKVTVKGTVSYEGKRVSSGMLQFVGPEGAYSASMVQPDGTFIMTDVLPGETKVGVMESPQGSGSSSSGDNKASAPPKVTPSSLPEKFRDPQKSGVSVTIAADTRELHIDLK